MKAAEIEWVHPHDDDNGQAAMKRIGVEIGEEFLVSSVASWEMPPGITSRRKGDGLWQRGHVVVHKFHRYRLAGWYAPQYGDADKGMVTIDGGGAVNVVMGGLPTGHIVGDPVLKFPIAKAPKEG